MDALEVKNEALANGTAEAVATVTGMPSPFRIVLLIIFFLRWLNPTPEMVA